MKNEHAYDVFGKIIGERYIDTETKIKSYVCDPFGQLIRENNQALDKTYVYSYNGIGNITGVQSYSYTTGELSGTPSTTSFGYSDDKLTSFNGSAITYNANGGVASYDGATYTWSKGKLSVLKQSLGSSARIPTLPSLQPSKTYSFTYNALGQRIATNYTYFLGNNTLVPIGQGEVIASSKTYFYDNAGRLLSETITDTLYEAGNASSEIIYLYDENSMIGMRYTSALNETDIYYYLRNLQGDVIAIYDTIGNKVVEYAYDAWGNCTIKSSTTNYTVAHANPIRYRGYYYDERTGLYYLNSRYYNPQWRRFISPDDTSYLDPETPNGLNLYAYCNNDPVNYADPSGNAPWWSWALSGLQMVVGSAMLWVPGMQTIGFSLAIGGAVGLMMTTLDPRLVQLLGGVNSVANGRGAASIGISLMSLGGWASLAGVGLFAVGIGTMIFGANEMVAAITGTNYIQRGLGMSDAAYALAYLGLNYVSSVGQTVGNLYRLHATREPRLGYDNQPNGYRYYDEKGDPFFDFDYPHGNIRYNHWHGWNGPGLTGRTDREHWSYLELILWMFGGG